MAVTWWAVILTFIVLVFGFFLERFLGGKKGLLLRSDDGVNDSTPRLDFDGAIDQVMDGFTLEIGGQLVRPALLKPPHLGDRKFSESMASAVVYCEERNLNSTLLKRGLASLDRGATGNSEFDPKEW